MQPRHRQLPSQPHRAALTPRMLEVLQLTADGCSSADIAESWEVSNGYVRKLKMWVLDELGADNMNHAVALGFRRGLIT